MCWHSPEGCFIYFTNNFHYVTTPGIFFFLLVYSDKIFRGFPQFPQAKVFSCLLFTNRGCYMIRTTDSELQLRLNKYIHSIKTPFCVLALDFLKRTHVSLILDGCNVYHYLATTMHLGLYILPSCKSVHCTNIKHWLIEWIDGDWQTVTNL